MTAFLLFLLLAPPPDCAKTELSETAGIKAWLVDGSTTFFYESGMAVDADGAPEAYHSGDTGLDSLKSAGHKGNWWALVTNTGRSSGTPIVQGPHDPAPGYYISTTSLEDVTKKLSDPHRYVDATKFPYFVLPPTLRKKAGVAIGDLAIVINRKNGKRAAAILRRYGPGQQTRRGVNGVGESTRNSGKPSYWWGAERHCLCGVSEVWKSEVSDCAGNCRLGRYGANSLGLQRNSRSSIIQRETLEWLALPESK